MVVKTRNIAIAVTILVAPAAWAQSNLVDWVQANGAEPVEAGAPGTVLEVRGGALNVFATREDFDTQFPVSAQTCEDFETNLFNDGDIVGFPAPLDETTDNAVFAAGSIIPGLTLQDNPLNDADGGAPNGLVGVGATAFGTPSDLVLANTFVDSLDILLADAPNALAMDVFSFTVGGTATVEFFDVGDGLIGSLDVAAGPATSGFVGVESPVGIARVSLSSIDDGGTDEAEGADNLCLAGAAQASSIPTLGPVGLALMVLALLAVAGIALGRRGRLA